MTEFHNNKAQLPDLPALPLGPEIRIAQIQQAFDNPLFQVSVEGNTVKVMHNTSLLCRFIVRENGSADVLAHKVVQKSMNDVPPIEISAEEHSYIEFVTGEALAHMIALELSGVKDEPQEEAPLVAKQPERVPPSQFMMRKKTV